MGNWTMLWFVLDRDVLLQYHRKLDADARCPAVSILRLHSAVLIPDRHNRRDFRIKSGAIKHDLRAETPKIASWWIAALHEQMAACARRDAAALDTDCPALGTFEDALVRAQAGLGTFREALAKVRPFSERAALGLRHDLVLRSPAGTSLSAAVGRSSGRVGALHDAAPAGPADRARSGETSETASLSAVSLRPAPAECMQAQPHLDAALESGREALEALAHCADIMSTQAYYWTMRLDVERDRRRVAEQALERLSAVGGRPEPPGAPHAVAPSGPAAGSGNESDSDHDVFLDAQDADTDTDAEADTARSRALFATPSAPRVGGPGAPGDALHNDVYALARAAHGGQWPYRVRLDGPMIDRSKVSVWSILKQCFGRDLSRVTMPVVFNEPLSFLQRLTEDLEYAGLLRKANQASDPHRRLLYVAAFALSGCASIHGRVGKPFNPLLGETFELDRPEIGRVICEQVSHHPPISALHCEHADYCFWESNEVRIRLRRSGIECRAHGLAHVTLSRWPDDHYVWEKPFTAVHNIFIGKIWLDVHGSIVVCNRTTGDRVVLDILPHASTTDGRNVVGYLAAANDTAERRRYTLTGNWREFLHCLPVDPAGVPADESRAELLWRSVPLPADSVSMYMMTPLAVSLDELRPDDRGRVAPTDARLRPDQRLLERGELDAASVEKCRLEEKQRLARRLRAERGEEFRPCWFEPVPDPHDPEQTMWRYRGAYWQCRTAGDFSRSPDIF